MGEFKYDVFLSHASADKPVVREFAARLKKHGLKVWFDEECIPPGASIPAEVERGLQESRVQLLFMSKTAFTRGWVNLERYTFIFRDPGNTERRFLPILIEDCDIPEMIRQFKYVDWREKSESEFAQLIASLPTPVLPTNEIPTLMPPVIGPRSEEAIRTLKGHEGAVGYVIECGGYAVSASRDHTLKVWDIHEGVCLRTLVGHTDQVRQIVKLSDRRIVSASWDRTLRTWDIHTGECLTVMNGHTDRVRRIVKSPTGDVISGSSDGTVKVWNSNTGKCRRTLSDRTGPIAGLGVLADGTPVWGTSQGWVTRWDLKAEAHDHHFFAVSVERIETLQGGNDFVFTTGNDVWYMLDDETKHVILSAQTGYSHLLGLSNGDLLAAGKVGTLVVTDIDGVVSYFLEGHTAMVNDLKEISPNLVASASVDHTIRIWNTESGSLTGILKGHALAVNHLSMVGDLLVSASSDGTLKVWDIANLAPPQEATKYTNAKVVLIGQSGVGKTGLSLRLADEPWVPTLSTHGMRVSQLQLPHAKTGNDAEREVWLWDLAGQPDYRLVHQLFMDETSLALLVIDPQDDNPFDEIEHWDKALRQSCRKEAAKLLVAARCDRGGAIVSQAMIDEFCQEHGIAAYFETAAQTGQGCPELKKALRDHIPWDSLPWTSTTKLFKALKDCIVEIKMEASKDPEAPVVLRLSELRQRLQLMRRETFEEAELRTVVGLLAQQGIIHVLGFGDKILLQPERLNAYAAAVVRSARKHVDEIGSVKEKDVLEGRIDFEDMDRLSPDDEHTLLRAIVEMFTGRALCLRESDPDILVFPFYFRKTRPRRPDKPNITVTFAFAGPLEEIYSTLVVRLSYTEMFEKDKLWHYAADFLSVGKKQLGFFMRDCGGGRAELEVHCAPDVPDETQALFLGFIRDHLAARAADVTRLRHYNCPDCGRAVENREAIRVRLDLGKPDIPCQYCDTKVPLRDLVEEKLGSSSTAFTLHKMATQVNSRLADEREELTLIGHCLATAEEAGQTFRLVPKNSGLQVDGELHFKGTDRMAYIKFVPANVGFFAIPKQFQSITNALPHPVWIVYTLDKGRVTWMQVGADCNPNDFEEPFTALAVENLRKRLTQE